MRIDWLRLRKSMARLFLAIADRDSWAFATDVPTRTRQWSAISIRPADDEGPRSPLESAAAICTTSPAVDLVGRRNQRTSDFAAYRNDLV